MPYINQSAGGALSGVTVTGVAAAGDVPVASSSSAASWKFPPYFEFGYDQITSPVNVLATAEGTPTTIITCAAHTFDGGLVMCEFFAPYVTTPSVTSSLTVILVETGSEITRLATAGASTNVSANEPMYGSFRFTPTAASHTYVIASFVGSTTGTPAIGAGTGSGANYPPAYVRFVKV